MSRCLGITVHTGWGACVVAGGSPGAREIVASQRIDILDGAKRFCFHAAATLEPARAHKHIEAVREEAVASAKRALRPLLEQDVQSCAIVAKHGEMGELAEILASHPRIHTAEGLFYRDVLREACGIPSTIVPPSTLDPATAGKMPISPWGRDQKLAALAAWGILQR
jgi:hypothetical protein